MVLVRALVQIARGHFGRSQMHASSSALMSELKCFFGLGKPWYFLKKDFESDIEEELEACICVSKGLQLRPLRTLEAKWLQFQILKRTLEHLNPADIIFVY